MMTNNININTIWAIAASLLMGALIGYFISKSAHRTISTSNHQHINTSETWTCAMHPQIRQNEPGDCPICGMDLIPLENEENENMDPAAVAMSPTAMQLANVVTAEVGEMNPVKAVRLNGKVQEDERLVFSQSTHIPGRIEQLMVNFTGEYVRKGQVIAHIYSPELMTAQEELFEAQKIKDTHPGLFQSAQEKLKNWKLSDAQIQDILKNGQPKEAFPTTADVSGYVTEKNVKLGDYVNRGEPIYQIANLSRVWVLFDVYESDLPWVHEGDRITFTIQSLPGKTFEDKITFLDPVIDPKTRVARARVEIENKDNQLKPEMFASGVVSAVLENKDNALVIPKSAVMWTGKRSVVYIKISSDQGMHFAMREVTLGQAVLGHALGESYIVEAGLEKGQEIAVQGTFSIDAAAQLAGKPSMMNRQNFSTKEISKNATTALQMVIGKYLALKNALVENELKKAKATVKSLQNELEGINISLFEGDARAAWEKQHIALQNALYPALSSNDLEAIRAQFINISDQMVTLVKTFKPMDQTLYVQRCPMADSDRGADWLSTEEEIRNPYFGNAMLTCGEVIDEIHSP